MPQWSHVGDEVYPVTSGNPTAGPRPSMASLGRSVATSVVACVAFAACSDEASPVTTAEPVLQVTVAEDDFCSQMAQIRVDTLDGDEDLDAAALAARYRNVLDQAPAEVRPDLEALIVELESGSSATTTTIEADVNLEAEAGEGWQPAGSPGVRVFEFVETHCSGTASNPGPAATAPP